MAGSITIPNSFQTQPGPIPLSQLDADFTAVANALNAIATFDNQYQDSSGVANTIIVTVGAPTTFAYGTGVLLQVRLANTNTGATQINVNGLGLKNVTNTDGSALGAGAMVANGIYQLQYDGTNFQLLGATAGTVGSFTKLTVGTPASGPSLTVNVLDGGQGVTFNETGTGGFWLGLSQSGTLRLGIGIGTAAFTGAGSADGGLFTNGSAIRFSTDNGASTRVLIANAGNVTIAAPSSGATLALSSTASGGPAMISMSASGALCNWLTYADSQAGGHTWYLGPGVGGGTGFNLYDSTGSRLPLSVAANGNVSIAAPTVGITLALTSLNATQSITQSCGSAAASLVQGFAVGLSAGGWNIYTGSTDSFFFGSGGAASSTWFSNGLGRVTLNSAGNLTINAPTSGTTLSINNIAGGVGIQVADGTVTSQWQTSSTNGALFGPTSNHRLTFFTNNQIVMAIQAQGTAGAVSVNGADISARGIALCRYKSANTDRSSTTTLSNDPDLNIALQPGTYLVRVKANICAPVSGAGGFAMNLNYSGTIDNSSGWTGFWGINGGAAVISNANLIFQTAVTTVSLNFATISTSAAGPPDYLLLEGILFVTTAGTLGVSWAQNSSNANATRMFKGSELSVTQIS